MRSLFLLVTIIFATAPVLAEETAGPKEVGSTTMPPGQYYVTEQISKKSYSLTVTDKGNMILGPAPEGVEVKVSGAATTTTDAATTAAAGTGAAAAGAAGAGAAKSDDVFKGLMKQGMQRGMSELVKQGGTKQIEKYIPHN